MNILATPQSKLRGVTLVELVTSLMIIGILSAVAAPRFFDQSDFQERAYVDELASSLRYARRIAIASECQVRFTINASAYSASQRSSPANCQTKSGPWSTPLRRSDGTILSGIPPTGVYSTPAASTLVFEDDGTLDAPAPAFVVGPFTLSIDQFSGTVSVTP